MKKLFGLALLCLLTLCVVTSCDSEVDVGNEGGENQVGTNDTENRSEPVKIDKGETILTGVYSSDVITLPSGYKVWYDEEIVFSDGEFRFKANYGNMKDDYKNFAVAKDGTLREVSDTGSNIAEAVQPDHWVNAAWETGDGALAFVEIYGDDYISSMFFSARDEGGNVIFSADIPAYMNYDLAWDVDLSRIGFRILDCLYIDGTYLLLTSEGLCAVNSNGTLRWSETSQKEPSAIAQTEVGVLYLSGTGGLRTVNMSDGKLGEQIELPEEIAGADQSEIYLGGGHDFYISNTIALWGVDFTVSKDGSYKTSSCEVINWQNSDIIPSQINSLCIADAETVMSNNMGDKIMLLKKVQGEVVLDRVIINVAQMGSNYNMPSRVKEFNDSSETHRVIVTDYSAYADIEQRMQMLNMDMAAGRVPDLIYFYPLTTDEDVLQTYVNSGIFTDLVPLLKADETFHYDDLLGYVTKPYLTNDGELPYFKLMPSLFVYTARADTLDGPITPEEMFELLDTLPEDTLLTAVESRYAKNMLTAAIEDYVDWDNYTCSFDDGTFAELIDRVRAIPELDYPYSDTSEAVIAMREGKLILHEPLLSMTYWFDLEYSYGGELVPVGIPNRDGKLIVGSSISPTIAILDSSENKAAAVDFLELFAQNRYFYGSKIDELYEEEYKDKTFVYKNGRSTIVDDEHADEYQGDKRKMTEEFVDKYKAFLNDIDAYLRNDTKVYEIAAEEIWNSNPDRTGKEIADIIQSRVSIYLAEISK